MLMTVEEYLAYPSIEGVTMELVRGELRMSPSPGNPHGSAIARLVVLLANYVDPLRLGRVFGDGTGYELLQLPRTVRIPDASFVRADRIPARGLGPDIFKFAPDLAVEVLSPTNRASALQEKIDDYRVSGTTLIWVVDPIRRTVVSMANDAAERLLHEGDVLTGGRVLPDFSCDVAQIFDGIARDLEYGDDEFEPT